MKARWALKRATAEHHRRVDRLFSMLDLADQGDYRLFLLAQASAHLPVEAALDAAGAQSVIADWAERRRAPMLLQDLAALGAEVPEPVEPPALPGTAATLGAIYVLEGSRLGGAMLKRGLPADAPKAFLGTEQPAGSWRKLLAKLDESLDDAKRVEEASDSARQVFMAFETAGRRFVES